MKKRILHRAAASAITFILSVCLLAGSVPAAGYAAETEAEVAVDTVLTIQETGCMRASLGTDRNKQHG